MSNQKSHFARVFGTIATVVVLLAVPAFAISFADASIFSRPTNVDPSAAVRVADDSTILNGWQFTGHTRHVRHTDHPVRHTDHPVRHTDHPVHHTDHRPVHHSDHRHHSRHTHTHHASKHTGH
jgi:hypothetical protein